MYLLLSDHLKSLEENTIDFRHAHFNRSVPVSDQVVLIDIDDQSLKNLAPIYGRWPFPRKIYRQMVEFLNLGEPSIILFDILFTEPQKGTDDDQQLAEITRASGNVSQAMQFLPESSLEDIRHVKLPPTITENFQVKWGAGSLDSKKFPVSLNDFSIPNPELLKDLPLLHVVSTDKDTDGIFRNMPFVVPYDQGWYPSMALRALTVKLKDPQLNFKNGLLEIFDGTLLKYQVPLADNGFFRLHFYDDNKRPQTYRLAEVIESAAAQQRGEDPSKWSVNPLDLQGKIILIGTSATGLEDLKATPVNRTYPGVLLHATIISNVLTHDYLKTPSFWFSAFIVFLFIVVSYFSVFFLDSIATKSLIPLTLMGGYLVASLIVFNKISTALLLVVPLGAGILAFMDAFIYMSFVEGRERKRMSGVLSKYLSPELTTIMINEGLDPSAEVGKRKELSIMFSDVRGFTTMSEMLKAESVVAILNEYLGAMTQIVFDHRGTLDKFIGDAVMAFWGAPVENPDHAKAAVHTAFAMQKRLQELNEVWLQQGQKPLAIGIGVNTGEVIVGNIGSEKRLDYTVIGDNVNLTSRLESLTKYYGVGIILGGSTYERVKEDYLCRPLDLVKVKGKNKAVAIYEPVCTVQNKLDFDKHSHFVSHFISAWEEYQKGDFLNALEKFKHCLKMNSSDGPTLLYIERCQELIEEPPKEWDGVYIAKSK